MAKRIAALIIVTAAPSFPACAGSDPLVENTLPLALGVPLFVPVLEELDELESLLPLEMVNHVDQLFKLPSVPPLVVNCTV